MFLNFLIIPLSAIPVPTQGGYRSRIDIYCTLLDLTATQEKIRKTKLMYASRLSHTNTTSCLEELTKSNLLEFDNHEKTYKISPKGQRFLELYKEMIKTLQP
jgi:predicted transcriptional regulator